MVTLKSGLEIEDQKEKIQLEIEDQKEKIQLFQSQTPWAASVYHTRLTTNTNGNSPSVTAIEDFLTNRLYFLSRNSPPKVSKSNCERRTVRLKLSLPLDDGDVLRQGLTKNSKGDGDEN
ncbi:hypothetical protein ACOSQ3_024193 [Xanthoceras sorbifolium]